MSDKIDNDIKSRLNNTPSAEPRKPITVKTSASASEGAQNNQKLPNAPALTTPKNAAEAKGNSFSQQPGGVQSNKTAESYKSSAKTPSGGLGDLDPYGHLDNSYDSRFARPEGKLKKKKSETGKDASLQGLKAEAPDSGDSFDRESQMLARAQDVGGSNPAFDRNKETTHKEGLEELNSKDYNTRIKEKVALSLRYRIPKKLANLANEKLHKLTNYISSQIETNRSNREVMMDRIDAFRENWRNFEEAGLNIQIDGQHNEHIPLIFEKGKSLHARIYKAVLGIEPSFVLKPRKAVSEKQKECKEDLDRWVFSDYMNKGEGINVESDKDIWNFVLDGTAIVKHYWERDVRKFVDVEVKQKLPLELDENGQLITEEKEIEKESVVYDGPMMKIVPLEDMYIIGARSEDVDDADMIAQRLYYTKSDLIKGANLGFFKSEAVDKCLEYRPVTNGKTSGYDTSLAQQESRLNGVNQQDAGIPVYTIHECYLRYDIDDDGIDEEIVVWREYNSGIILRITYLDRVSPTGKRPFVLKKLIPAAGSPYGIGFGEMLHGINNLLDYIANQRLDAGTFQTFPWFVFRAGSGLQGNDIRIGPGKGIAVDNVNDIAFPKVNGNPAYGFQEEALITDYAERVSGVSRLAQGQVGGGQGVARTATGAASLVSELNTNLDIFISRYQFGFKKSLGIIDKQIQELLPLGLEYRVTGIDKPGAIYRRFTDRDSIKFDVDFELVGNSINSNPAIERDTAAQLLQYALNPIMLQSGIVGPKQIYNAMKNMLQKLDIRDTEAYIQSPDGSNGYAFTAQDEINAIAAGVELPVQIQDNHEAKLAYYQAFEDSDEFGILTPSHMQLYHKMKSAHEKYMQAMAAQTLAANNVLGLTGTNVAAQIAGASGAPQGVPQQMTDLAPASSPMVNNGGQGQ